MCASRAARCSPWSLPSSLVLGLGLDRLRPGVAARSRRSPPHSGTDHWHGAYGFQLCTDTPNVQLTGNLEEDDANGNLVDSDFVTTGVHSHDDGVIHWHPYGIARAGTQRQARRVPRQLRRRAHRRPAWCCPRAGFTRRTAAPPPDDFPLEYEEGETQCDGEDARSRSSCGPTTATRARARCTRAASTTSRSTERPGVHVRLRARRRRRRDAAVGRQPRAARRSRPAPPVPGETLPASPVGEQRADRQQRADGDSEAAVTDSTAPTAGVDRAASRRRQRAARRPRGSHRARHRAGRRVRHPAAPADQHGAEVDADGRQRADHHPPRPPARTLRRHHGHAVARVPPRPVPRRVPRRPVRPRRAALRRRAGAARHRRGDPLRRRLRRRRRDVPGRSTATSSATSTSTRSSPRTAGPGRRRRSTSRPSPTPRRSASSRSTRTAASGASSRSRRPASPTAT